MGSFRLDGRQPGQQRCSSSCWPQLSSTSAEVTVWGLTSTRLNTERRTTREWSTTSSPRLSPLTLELRDTFRMCISLAAIQRTGVLLSVLDGEVIGGQSKLPKDIDMSG